MDNGNGNGVASLEARLHDPNTISALNRLLDRIETLEESVSRLADVVEQAPGFTAMVGDMVDDTYRKASERGVDLEARFQTGLEIAEKLTTPEIASRLDQLLALVDEAPGFTAMVGDMVDESIKQAASHGVNLEERVQIGLTIAEKLTAPETSVKLDQLLELADSAPSFVAMLGDIADEAYRNAIAQGIDLERMMQSGITATQKLSVLLESGILDDGAIRVVGATGKALAEASNEKIEPVGLLGMLSALRDPNTQRALGFLLNVSKHLGKELA